MSGNKTEQPTPKRLRDARKKGQVASSKDVVSAALMVALMAFIWMGADDYYRKLEEVMLLPVPYINSGLGFRNSLDDVLMGLVILMFQLIAPPLGLVIIVAIVANVGQFGLLLSLTSIIPELKKLNPLQGLKKIFSLKNLIESAKSILKIALLSWLLYLVIRKHIADLLQLPYCGLECIPVLLAALMADLAVNAAAAFIIIAGADFAFQRFQFTKQNKMTKDEVKREYKEMEGDPRIKSKRRHLHREMMTQNMTNSVRKSTVVVTNPTHLAIALEYREGSTPLPVVRAKGENLMAKRIIEIAREEGIPIMENVPLAHALHEQASVDDYIPADLITAVAEVLRWVAQLEQH